MLQLWVAGGGDVGEASMDWIMEELDDERRQVLVQMSKPFNVILMMWSRFVFLVRSMTL